MYTLSWLVDDSFSTRLAVALLHFVWQGSCVGLVVWIGGVLLSSATARLRYWLSVTSLVVMGACLPITFVLVESPGATRLITSAVEDPLEVREPVLPVAADAGPTDTVPVERRSTPAVKTAQPPASKPRPALWLALATDVLPAASRWIVLLYLSGVVCILARLMLGVWGGQRLRSLAVPIEDPGLLASFRKLAQRVDLKVAPTVAWCEQISVPVVVGLVTPTILLPLAVMSNLTPDQLQALVLHELSHIRRYDPLVNLLQRVVEAILFFHPAIWFVSRRISLERELAADDMVLAAGWDRPHYADALVRMAELASMISGQRAARQAATLAATGTNPSEFKVRILRLLDEPQPPKFALSRTGVLLTVSLILVSGVLAWSQAEPEAAPPRGLEFLKPYPALHGLSLEMTEAQFLAIIKQQKLEAAKSGQGDQTQYQLGLGDGHTLIVMFDKVGKCRGIQRGRGEVEDAGRLLAAIENKLVPGNSVLSTIDNGPVNQCRAVIKQLDDAAERKLASMARERLAKRWKRIAEQPVLSFVRPSLPKDPAGKDIDRGETVGIQTELDGVWWEGKGTAENWTDWIRRKQDDYRVDRLKLLFEAADGYRQVEDAASAERVLVAGLTGHEIYDADLQVLLGKYWPVISDEPGKSLGPGPQAWTLVNFLEQLSAAQQAQGEIERAISTHSRLTLAHFLLSWQHPSAGPTRHARELWALIRQRPESLPPLFWFNLVDEKKPQQKFDLSKAGKKGELLTYHHRSLAAAPPLEFKELTITAQTHGQGFIDCYRINPAGKHETIGSLRPSATGEADQKLTKKLVVPAGTSLVQFMVGGDSFQVGEVTVEATFAPQAGAAEAPAAMGAAPEFGLGQRQDVVHWSHDSQQLYATGDFDKLTVWEHGEAGWKPRSLKAEHHANSMAASRKSPLLIAGTNVGTAEVWDATAHKRLSELRSSPNYSVYAVAISADDKLIAACGTDGTVQVFDREPSKPLAVLGEKSETRMASLSFAPDGKSLAALDRYGQLALWKLSDGTRLAEWKNIAGEDCSVHWSPDGAQLAVSGWGRVTLIAAEKGSQPRVVEAPEAVLSRHPTVDEFRRSGPEPGGIKFASVTAIAPDLRTAASVAPDASIGIWHLATRKILHTLPAPEKVAIMDSQSAGLRNLAFSPNGQRLACTTLRGEVVFWKLR